MPVTAKLLSMREAVAEYVRDGLSVAVEGFTGAICFAAGHEIIRQRRRDLTLIRMTPDIIYDQMVAAGVARKLVFSYLGNPGVGPLHAIRRAVEHGIPTPLEIEEYSHYGMVGRYMAGAMRLPFFPLRSYLGSDLPQANERIKWVESPYGEGRIAVVPPLNPDVAILHAQRADASGNTHLWGLLGVQKEVAFAAAKVIVVVEEIVDESVIRSDPNRTLIPSLVVDAVVLAPFGAHPSYVQGYYDRDNAFYLEWDALSRDQARTEAWLEEWVYGIADHSGYLLSSA
jgi:glutaconate CoA-transferase, subunit A